MRAATSMMLFSFRRRKQAEDAGERSDKRMLTPVLDSIHGAHLDGGAIVLWKGIGGGSYPAREVGPWIYDEAGSGMFRLEYQPTTTIGAPTGPPVATTVVFIGIDFLSGVAADRTSARREGRAWYFESCKAWRTVVKLTLAVTAIAWHG